MKSLPYSALVASLLTLGCLCTAAEEVRTATRSSATYSITTDSLDSGGARLSSASYTVNAGAGALGALAINATSPTVADKGGYIGQLYDIKGFALDANPMTIDEKGTRQLTAGQLLDDGTKLAISPSSVSWSIASGPLTSISTGGLATAGNVYQSTLATVQGSYNGNTGSLSLTVLNVDNDNFGSYAGDGIDDAWQVQYFGQPPNANAGPNVDFDGTGQTNLFKYVAGLNPLDGSRFTLSIENVAGQPGQERLIFSPLGSGRTYVVEASSQLVNPSWSPLAQSTFIDSGNVRTVTDLNALPAPKYYRVQISKP
jgi:hypothetical protein